MSNYYNLICPYHPKNNLIEDHAAGDVICTDCGLVVGDRTIDLTSEWRTFAAGDNGSEDKSRVGGEENHLLHGNNLSTIIGPGTGKASFNSEGKAMYTNWSRTSGQSSTSERTLHNAFNTITDMADKINISQSIIDRANQLVKTVHDGHKVLGEKNKVIAAACLYIACRQEKFPRTFKEIVAVSKEDKMKIAGCYKLITKNHNTNVKVINSRDFMARLYKKLDLKTCRITK